MMLKANGEYLDFNSEIDIEKKIKLFEDIQTADGDMSFAFDIELTSNNLRILGIPLPDSSSKIIYELIPSEVQNDAGITINIGSLKVERIIGYIASCSFLGGNTNWFAMLDGDMTELRLSSYDRDQDESNIVNSWAETEGVIFPFIDLGALITRGAPSARIEDFVGCFYLHTLFKEVFNQSGIKIQGDLLNDSLYNQIVIATNTRSVIDKNNNSLYVGTNTPQVALAASFTKITLEDTTIPFYIGDDITNVSNQDFYFPAKMAIEWETSIKSGQGTSTYLIPIPYVNGSIPGSDRLKFLRSNGIQGDSSTGFTNTLVYSIVLEAGDYISLYGFNGYGSSVTTQSAYMRVTPLIIYKAFGRSCVPLWTKQQFVSNILKAFNVITSYNQFTKTLTLDLFDKIKTKPAIEIGQYLRVDEIDYSDFISNYGQINNFSYQEGSDEELNEYNIGSFIKYGAGVIESRNKYIEKTADVIDLDFTAPISYFNPAFNCSMERINFVELTEGDETDITSVTDASGVARFNITDADDFYALGDLVRVVTANYTGDFTVNSVTSTYIQFIGVTYTSSASGTAKKLTFEVTTDDSVYMFIQIPFRPIDDIMALPLAYVEENYYVNWSLAFFNLIKLGRTIEDEYKQGLSFGQTESELSFQKTLIDKYWQQFRRILNDPVKLLTTGNLPWKVYESIDFLQPVSITTKESSNLYYVNRILGYKDSSIGCEVDLIKLP